MINVAVGIITDINTRVLITQRSSQVSHGGMWEFPGGKLEPGENAESALIREIKEEVGLSVIKYDYLGEICHTYSTQSVSLLVYHIYEFSGEARICESQLDMRWVHLEHLNDFKFPAANIDIIKLFQQRLMSSLCE